MKCLFYFDGCSFVRKKFRRADLEVTTTDSTTQCQTFSLEEGKDCKTTVEAEAAGTAGR